MATKSTQKQLTFADVNDDYAAFVEKFKPKKTTDDCYTPKAVYEVVADWVSREYGIRRDDMVRPFWPGGDYMSHGYPDGCCVVDNPPFSILAKIVRFYLGDGIRFFLFSPTLTNLSIRGVTHIIQKTQVVYENGAKVSTSFITNLDTRWKIRTEPELSAAIEAVNRKPTKTLPKYEYPLHVLTAAAVSKLTNAGIDYRLSFDDGFTRIGALDEQKLVGKTIFGGGYLLSDKAAADKAAADKADVTVWQLSDRELEIVKLLSKEQK